MKKKVQELLISRLLFITAFVIPTANAQNFTLDLFADGDTTSTYIDATSTLLPADADAHTLDVILVDVDKDGDLDMVFAVELGENRLYLNNGTGKFTWKRNVFGSSKFDTEHVLSADFNQDGYPDIIFVAEDDKNHQLFFGTSTGEFIDATDRLPKKSEGNGLAVGDVNGDGLDDIVIGNSGENRPGKADKESGQDFLWLNNQKNPGHFLDVTETHLPVDDDDTQDIKLVDLNGNGHLDLIIANENQANRLLFNDGTGRFIDASENLEQLVEMETRQVQILDANGDGHLDLLFFNLTSNNKGWDKDPQLRLLINNGDAKFTDQTKVRLPENKFSSWGGIIVDFNHDGYPDILVGAIEVPGFVPLQLRAWQNNGQGNFKDVTETVVPSTTIGRHWGMATGDVNGDGIADVVIGGWGTQARLLLGRQRDSQEE